MRTSKSRSPSGSSEGKGLLGGRPPPLALAPVTVAAIDPPIDAEAVAEVVAGCRSVARLTPGSGVELVTYLPGRRVPGVRMGDAGLEVHVVARYGPTMPEVAAEIRTALRPLLGGAEVSVVIHDVDLGPDAGPEAPAAGWT